MIRIVISAGKKHVDAAFGASSTPAHPIPLILDQLAAKVDYQNIRLLLSDIHQNTHK